MENALDILKELAERDGDCRTDLRVVVGSLMFAFEGPAGFARAIKLEFDNSNEGSTVRTKILTTILDLLTEAAEGEEQFEEEDYAAMDRQMQGANGNAG